jgi:hypothetical protein
MRGGLTLGKIKDSTNSATKTKNSILAIVAAAPAMPPKPSNAAIMAKTTNVSDQPSINPP